MALDPRTGDILALVGGRDFRQSQFNRAARSRRQPGSAFKPLLYAAALENGYSPVSVLEGLANIVPQGPEEWSPRNADGETPDALTLRAALLESNNRAATMLQQKVGSRPVLRLASQVGLEGLPDVPSLSLGTGLVTPLNMTAAFATFPNGGLSVRPRGILRVVDADGVAVFEDAAAGERVISAETAFQMVSMLQDVVTQGTGTAARQMGHPRADRRKDGHHQRFQGRVVRRLLVVDRRRRLGGVRSAAEDWRATPTAPSTRCRSGAISCARRCVRGPGGEFAVPATLHDEPLCRISYLRPVEGCPTYTEYFKAGDQVPGRLCPIHQGSIKQRVRRAVEGFLSGLGKRIGSIFSR